MTRISKRNQKVKEYIIKTIESQGFTEDQYGNWKDKDGTYRFKFQATSYRYEKRINTSPSHWIKLSGTYYKNVEIDG